jgi:hypothetical protein
MKIPRGFIWSSLAVALFGSTCTLSDGPPGFPPGSTSQWLLMLLAFSIVPALLILYVGWRLSNPKKSN